MWFLGFQISKRSSERINNLTQRRQDAKGRKEQLLCFLSAFWDFAPLREMLLVIQGLFHSFKAMSALRGGSEDATRRERPYQSNFLTDAEHFAQQHEE